MGHEKHNPIRERLNQAINMSRRGPVRPTGIAIPPIRDEQADADILREWVLRNHAAYGFDPVWVLTGIGRPPEADSTPPARLTPVFDQSAIDRTTGQWHPMVLERIALPPDMISPRNLVIRLDDRSMEPRLHLGAYLVIDPDQLTLPDPPADPQTLTPDGRVFAVALPWEGLVVRMAHRDSAANRAVLSALNRDCPPLSLPLETVEEHLLGRVVRLAQAL